MMVKYIQQLLILLANSIDRSFWKIFRRVCEYFEWYQLSTQRLALIKQGELVTAIPIAERALDLARKIFPGSNVILASSLGNLALLYCDQGRWDEAEPLFERSLEILLTLFRDRPNLILATSLNNLGGLYRDRGRWDEAEPFFDEALAILRTLFRDRPNNDLAASICNLARLYRHQGKWAEAELLCNEGLSIYRTLSGSFPSNQLAASLGEMAAVYFEQGKWDKAELLFDESLDIYHNLYGDRPNNHLAASLNNLAMLYEKQGKRSEAKHLYEKAIAIHRNLCGERPNNDLATSLNNLAELYRERGRWDDAEHLYEEAIDIVLDLFGERPNQYIATSLNNLAGLYAKQGRLTEAETLYKDVLSIWRNLFGDSLNHHIASSLGNLAGLYEEQGRWAEAKPLYEEALNTEQKLFDETGHPSLVTSFTNIALAYARLEQPNQALYLFQQAIASENKWLTNIIAMSDAQQRIKNLEKSQYRLECLLSLTQQYFSNDPNLITEIFNTVLSRKAQAATAEATFSQALRNQPALALDIAEYQACKQDIATISYAISSQPQLQDRFKTLLKQRCNLEKKLARSIPAIDLAQQVIDRQALTELLPRDAFLVEFVRYRDYEFTRREWQPARYLAFIVRHDREGVTAIDCGLAEDLDMAIKEFRSAYARSDFNLENSSFKAACQKSKPAPKIAQPNLLTLLLSHFPTTGTCYLAPDSHLHILPFHLLETPDGQYLGDRYQIHYLNTARDLLRRQIASSSNAPLVLADPDYDGGNNAIPFSNPKMELQASDRLESKPFERLDINRILGERVATIYRVPCYRGIEATVNRLTQLDAPSVLAIATHGFSLPVENPIANLITCPIEEEEIILSKHQHEITTEVRDYWQERAEQGYTDGQRILAIIDRYGVRCDLWDNLAQLSTINWLCNDENTSFQRMLAIEFSIITWR
jgi:tetratricopeptide (TPR) repeat protein